MLNYYNGLIINYPTRRLGERKKSNHLLKRIIGLYEIVYKDIDIKDKLLKERDFNRLLRLVEECLKIPREKSKLLLKYSLLNPIFSIHKDNFGKLIKAIEQEWKIQFDKGHVTLLCFESVESLYRLLKRTLNNEDN